MSRNKHVMYIHPGPQSTPQAVDAAVEQLIDWAVTVLERECRTSKPSQDTYRPQTLLQKDAA